MAHSTQPKHVHADACLGVSSPVCAPATTTETTTETAAETATAHSALSRRRFMAAVATACVAGGGLAARFTHPQIALAETSAEVREQANEVLTKLQALQDDLDIKANTYQDALAEEEAARALMEDAQRRMDEAQAKIDKLKARLSLRVRGMYKSGDTSFLDILFGSTSFASFVNNVQLLDEMNKNDADMVEETKLLKADIAVEKAEYERQEAIAEAKRKEAEAIMQEAQAVVDEIAAIYRALDAKANALLREEIAEQRRREEAARAAAAAAAAAARNNQGARGNRGANVPYDPAKGEANVRRAQEWVGRAEYVWCACKPGAFDCSGLVAYAVTGVYRRIGTTWTFWNNNYGHFPDVTDYPQRGDICVIHTGSKQHCGIYVGDHCMIHSADYGIGVIQGWFDQDNYHIVRYVG